MSTLIQVDARKRISLGSLAHHDQYIATESPDGSVLLEPAVVLTAAEHAFLADETLSAALSRVNAPRTKKDPLKTLDDFSKLPVAVHIGQVAMSVEEYSGRAVLSLSLVGWVGEAPFKILAADVTELEDALANLRKQLS